MSKKNHFYSSWQIINIFMLLALFLSLSQCTCFYYLGQLQVISVTSTSSALGAVADYTFSIFNLSIPSSPTIGIGSKVYLTFNPVYTLSSPNCAWESVDVT